VERYGSSAYASWDERTTEELRSVYDGLNDIIGKENGD
jgi:hypothetical protein